MTSGDAGDPSEVEEDDVESAGLQKHTDTQVGVQGASASRPARVRRDTTLRSAGHGSEQKSSRFQRVDSGKTEKPCDEKRNSRSIFTKKNRSNSSNGYDLTEARFQKRM